MNKPEQLRLAADIIEKDLEWQWNSQPLGWVKADHEDIIQVLKSGCEIRIKPTDPHPNRKEVEEGIRQGRGWEVRFRGQSEWERARFEITPAWQQECEYRLAPEPKKVPLGPQDVPPGSVIRDIGATKTWWMVTTVDDYGAGFSDDVTSKWSWDYLLNNKYLISYDFGRTWHSCEKDEPSSTNTPT